MYRQSYDQLLEQQRNQLEIINAEVSDRLKRLTLSLDCIHKNLNKLKESISKQPFIDTHEEIKFFKEVKPQFYSDKVLVLEQYQLEFHKPEGPEQTLITYYESELEHLERFFKLNAFHYQYYRSEFEELDHLYFLRGKELPENFVHEVPNKEPDFSTALDYLFAKFTAYERLRYMILNEIAVLKTPVSFPLTAKQKASSTLQWTGDSINLVEIAYGVWLTGQLNNGNASISEIIRWLEDMFQVKIGRAHRRWTEISQRKRSSYTKYLDRMQQALLNRIDNELGVKT